MPNLTVTLTSPEGQPEIWDVRDADQPVILYAHVRREGDQFYAWTLMGNATADTIEAAALACSERSGRAARAHEDAHRARYGRYSSPWS